MLGLQAGGGGISSAIGLQVLKRHRSTDRHDVDSQSTEAVDQGKLQPLHAPPARMGGACRLAAPCVSPPVPVQGTTGAAQCLCQQRFWQANGSLLNVDVAFIARAVFRGGGGACDACGQPARCLCVGGGLHEREWQRVWQGRQVAGDAVVLGVVEELQGAHGTGRKGDSVLAEGIGGGGGGGQRYPCPGVSKPCARYEPPPSPNSSRPEGCLHMQARRFPQAGRVTFSAENVRARPEPFVLSRRSSLPSSVACRYHSLCSWQARPQPCPSPPARTVACSGRWHSLRRLPGGSQIP